MSSRKRPPQIFLEDDVYKKLSQKFKLSDIRKNKKTSSSFQLNKEKLTRKRPLHRINEQSRRAENQRTEDMRKIKTFVKTGFERSFEILTTKIRVSQEIVSAEVSEKFYLLEGGMSDLNRNMLLMDENNYNNAKVLQYRIVFVQRQIEHLRQQTLIWIKQLDTANQKRQEQILKYIEQLSEQAVKLAQQLSDQLGKTEKKLSDGIMNVAKQIVTLHNMIVAKFGSLENFIQTQGQDIRTEIYASYRRLDSRIDQLIYMI